ncbi:MAG: trehalose 6-phosphate synthase/phosphatase [Arenicella sp.]|jgi:trehalose 6-phosphate synthase/phosphatase
MARKTIIISNRLPVTVDKSDEVLNFTPSAGGLATGLGSIYKEGENVWLGWPGFTDFEEGEKDSIISELKKENMAPVFLTEEDVELYYEGFSNRTIWPLFHYFTQYTKYIPELWEAYKNANRKFADEVLKYASDGDIIWVHDYQLLLLPQMIREKLPNSTIGFFQHIPFPSYEIFRLLPWREELLTGMLGADLIGFHTYDDMRHFLSSVNRIVALGNSVGKIKVGNRLVAVDSFPMGIDYEKFENAAKSEETKKKITRYSSMIDPEKIILSIDRLDYSKGIMQRLKAFDIFLEKYPQYVGQVSMILIVVPSRTKVDQYQQLKSELDEWVGRLNGKYSRMEWTPLHYFYRSFSFNALSALYSKSEVALVTPLRDGMNLVCKEFIASKTDKKGVLILSEMAGAARELSEAILINPNDVNQIVEAMKTALEMPENEQIARIEEMQGKLKRYNIHRWVEVFMAQLDSIKIEQKGMNAKVINEEMTKKIVSHYQSAEKRVFFFDYDGTLRSFVKRPEDAKPDEEMKSLLLKLAENKQNKVVVISGRDRHTLQEWLGHLPIDMIAEHGVWSKKIGKEWKKVDNIDADWKVRIQPMVELYVDRTPGSFIEQKDYSLVWHYRKADPDFGAMRARELLSNINYLIANEDLQTMEGDKVIEIKHRDVNKGKASKKWLGKDKYDFIFAIGDDVTDEDTFHAMPKDAYTVKVGLAPSEAKFNMKSTDEVREIIKRFAEVS